jgi:hypothetical protein
LRIIDWPFGLLIFVVGIIVTTLGVVAAQAPSPLTPETWADSEIYIGLLISIIGSYWFSQVRNHPPQPESQLGDF